VSKRGPAGGGSGCGQGEVQVRAAALGPGCGLATVEAGVCGERVLVVDGVPQGPRAHLRSGIGLGGGRGVAGRRPGPARTAARSVRRRPSCDRLREIGLRFCRRQRTGMATGANDSSGPTASASWGWVAWVASQHPPDDHQGQPVYPRSPGMGCTVTPAAVRNCRICDSPKARVAAGACMQVSAACADMSYTGSVSNALCRAWLTTSNRRCG